jgi:prepilin-type N-terminal cleavage/methylation domain-containing protein
MMKNTHTRKGFTLLETLVAVSVLMIAITATFTAAQSGLSAAIEAKDQVVAFYLAQEAVESVRNVRDENAINTRNWLFGISETVSDPCYFGKACTFDPPTRAFTACPSGPGTCTNLRQDTDTQSLTYGMYGYTGGWSATNFNREISFTSISSNEVLISVTVTWTKGLTTRSFRVRESLHNWQ